MTVTDSGPVLPAPGANAGATDHLFIQMGERAFPADPGVPPSGLSAAKVGVLYGPQPPPHGDPQGEQVWLRHERDRLAAFTEKQLALVHQKRHEMEVFHSQVEARLIAREQEVNRQQYLLEVRLQTLQLREAACKEREAALAARKEAVERAGAELPGIQQNRDQVAAALNEGQQNLDEVKAEVQRQSAVLEEMRRQQAVLDEAIRVHVQEEASWAKQRTELRRRLLELEKAEDALRQRTAALEQDEEEMSRELEQQEWEQRRREREWESRCDETMAPVG